MSTVPASLLRAYRDTLYLADDAAVFVGRRSAAMDRLLRRHGTRSGVFLTAWNPMSRPMPMGWNMRMQSRLAQHLRRIPCLPAVGVGRCWREAHVLVLANPLLVCRLARRFRQRAVLIVRAGQPAELSMRPSDETAPRDRIPARPIHHRLFMDSR